MTLHIIYVWNSICINICTSDTNSTFIVSELYLSGPKEKIFYVSVQALITPFLPITSANDTYGIIHIVFYNVSVILNLNFCKSKYIRTDIYIFFSNTEFICYFSNCVYPWYKFKKYNIRTAVPWFQHINTTLPKVSTLHFL